MGKPASAKSFGEVNRTWLTRFLKYKNTPLGGVFLSIIFYLSARKKRTSVATTWTTMTIGTAKIAPKGPAS